MLFRKCDYSEVIPVKRSIPSVCGCDPYGLNCLANMGNVIRGDHIATMRNLVKTIRHVLKF